MIKYGYGKLIMTEYREIYKCRLCGEKFEDGRTGRDTAYMGCAVLAAKEHFKPEGCAIGVHRHNTHVCDDGSYGFADFVGFKKVDDEDES